MPANLADPLGIESPDQKPDPLGIDNKPDPLGIDGGGGAPKFESPIELAPVSERDIAETDKLGNPIANIGSGLNLAGKALVAGAGDAGATVFRPLTDKLYPEQAGPIPNPTENLDALMAGEKRLPAEDLRALPKAAQLVGRGAQGLIETAPRLAAVTAAQAAGVPAPIAAGAVFGATEEGFDPEQAAIAALLPFVGKYSGKMVESLASKLGVTKEAALEIFNKLGGATGAAAVLKGVDEYHLSKDKSLSPIERDQARIDSWANVAAMSVLGAIESRESNVQRPKSTAEATSETPAGTKFPLENEDLHQPSAAEPVDLSDLEATIKGNQVKPPLAENRVDQALEELRGGEKVKVEEAHKPAAAPEPAEEPVSISSPSNEEAKMDTAALERELGKSQEQPPEESAEDLQRQLAEETAREPETEKPSGAASDAPQPGQSVQSELKGEESVAPAAAGVKPSATGRVGRGLRARKIFDRETEMNGPDILDYIVDSGGMLSKTGAREKWGKEKFQQNKSLWDDAPARLERPHHNVIYDRNASRAPDQVAQAAYDDGLLSEPSVNELWSAIGKASKTRSKAYEQQRRHEKILQEEIEQHERWNKAKNAGDVRIDAEDLQPGDKLVLDGTTVKVTGRDERTGDITIEDGSKFGVQRLESGQSIFVEKANEAALERANAHENLPEAVSKPTSEKIVAAAIRMPDGEVRTGRMHPLIEGFRDSQPEDQGFVTDTGRFVTRDEANQIAGKDVVNSKEFQQGIGRFVHPDDRSKVAGSHAGDYAWSKEPDAAPPEPPAAEHQSEPSDPVLKALARARAAVDPLKALKKGELHAMALPEWMARTTADFALNVIEKSYKLGNALYHAIEDGVNWLREQKIPNFDEREARDYLTHATREAQIAGPAKSRMEKFLNTDERAAADAEAIAESQTNPAATPITGPKVVPKTKPVREVPPQPGERDWREIEADMNQADSDVRSALKNPRDKQKQALAAAIFRNRREELYNHPGYVEHLLRQADELSKRIQEAHDAGTEVEGPRPTSDLRREQENVTEALNQVPEKLRNATYARLQDEGVIPKPERKPVGRSLDQLTDRMKEMNVDSPRMTIRDRFDIGQKAVERWAAIENGTQKAHAFAMAAWKAGIESLKHPPIDRGFRNALKDWIFFDQATGYQNRRWQKMLDSKVQKPDRQKAMSVWLDAKGDEGTIRLQAAQVPKEFQKFWNLALRLTHGEKELATMIRDEFRAKLEDGKTVGFLEHGRTDYGVPQFWKVRPESKNDGYATKDGPKGSPGNWKAKLDARDPFFAFQREYDTMFEGMMHGGIPADLRIGSLVAAYNEAFNKSLSSRGFIWSLKNEVASDGRPLVKISGAVHQVSDGEAGTYFVDSRAGDKSAVAVDGDMYRRVDHFALSDWKVAFKTSDGKPILVKGDFLVHPEAVGFLKNQLEQPIWRDAKTNAGKAYLGASAVSRFFKESKLALGVFHLTTVGEHAVFHLVNPFRNGFEIDLRNPDQALLVRNGLELGMGRSQVAFEEGLTSHGGLFSWIPGIGDYSRAFSDWLFKEYIPMLSMKAGLEVLRRNRGRYEGKLSESQIAELTAHQMNAAFGYQNYRLLGRSRLLQDFNSLAMLAPQFLEARAKVVAQAFKPYGAEQRMMLGLQAATLYVGARILSSMLDGDPHWELENAFNVVYQGRAYGLRTIVSDTAHLKSDPASFAAGRLGPWVKGIYETVFQRDMRTGARKQPPLPTNSKVWAVAQNLFVDVAKWLIPAGFEGWFPGAAGREQTKVGNLLSLVGIGSHKYTPETEVHHWATEFNRHSSNPAIQQLQRDRDSEVLTQSKYRKLDALLDAGEPKQAAEEYDALLKDGHRPDQIAQRYEHSLAQSFTGSRTQEAAFKASLSDSQKEIYQRAIAERQSRLATFRQMLAAHRSPN